MAIARALSVRGSNWRQLVSSRRFLGWSMGLGHRESWLGHDVLDFSYVSGIWSSIHVYSTLCQGFDQAEGAFPTERVCNVFSFRFRIC